MPESNVASVEQIIVELTQCGMYPDASLIDRCLNVRDDITDTLLSSLANPAPRGSWLDLHAALLLIDFREVRALPFLDEIYRNPARESRLGPWLNIQVPAYGPIAVPMLLSIACDANVDNRCRISSVDVLHSIASHHRSQKPLIAAALRKLLPALTSDGALEIDIRHVSVASDDITLWSAVVSTLITCKDEASRYQVIALYSKGYLDTDVVPDLDEYTHLLRFVDSHEATPPPLPINQAYARFMKWDGLNSQSVAHSFEAHLASAGVSDESVAMLAGHLKKAAAQVDSDPISVESAFPAATRVLKEAGVSTPDIPVALAMLLKSMSEVSPVITPPDGDSIEFVYRSRD